MKLLLFDIDGTLLLTHGIGRRAVERSLSEVCGKTVDTSSISFSGKTDPQIIREVLIANGLDGPLLDGLIDAGTEAYREAMVESILPERVEVLPGVHELIAALDARDDVQLALLTGNLEPLAFKKLAAAELDHYFHFGAFGSDHADRYQLPPIALERAREATSYHFEGKDVVIIGDTEHDIGCGRGIGAFSVAVCTGRFDRACLSAHGADVLFDRLDNTPAFIDAVLTR